MSDTQPKRNWRPQIVTEGEWAGWWGRDRSDSFEGLTGPFYWRRDDDGKLRAAFRAEPKHMNGGGFMHGGCLLTFADFLLFTFAREDLGPDYGVTATLNAEFLGSVHVGDVVEGVGEVVKAGGSLIFVRGTVVLGASQRPGQSAGQPVLTFSGVIKKRGAKPKR